MFDAVIIGTGAGGGAAAFVLAPRGWKIAVIEKEDTRRFAEPIESEKKLLTPRIGEGFGGSTSLYGAIMLRPSEDDFIPGRYYSKYLSKCDWQWPFQYEDLSEFYNEAEDQFRVSGKADEVGPYLGQRNKPFLSSPRELLPSNKALRSTWVSRGISSFLLPEAIDHQFCRLCPNCPGYLCPTDARSSSLNRLLLPALQTGNVTLIRNAQATSIKFSNDNTATGVLIQKKSEPSTQLIQAKVVVCAAGAMGSPQIFFQSGLCEKLPAIGRYLSFHCGVFGIRIQFRKKETTQLKTKQLGSTEYYFGTKSMRHKLGLIQDIPLPGSFSIKEGGNSNVQSRLLQQAFASFKQRSQSFGMIIEDIPQASNMLRFTGDSQRVRLCHSFHHYDLWRLQLARKLLKEMLTDKETVSCLLFDSVLQKSLLSHAVGTLRSGKSLKNSVVDSNGKVHGIDNVFVTDGSVLPTSMGVGPALTIVANAFRISQKI